MRLRLLAVVTLVASVLVAAVPATAAPSHTVTPLYFTVQVGPNDDQACDIVGDLYLPADASSSNRVPAILTTNGFGGSKDDQAEMGARYADRGYAVLSYSGLGFGGSGCKITLDDPEWDGKAAQQLIDYLAGESGVAFSDEARTVPAPSLDVVQLDAPGDPRIGMVGGSYGGAIQFATASLDDRLDALVPLVTWHDLAYSLAPNNLTPSADQPATAGVAKLFWALGFTIAGLQSGVTNLPADPGRILACPNFATFVCTALVVAGVTGFGDASTIDNLQQRSAISYGSTITAPTLLVQGQSDTLFNLNEGIANYEMLQGQGVETKMIWANGGHSGPMAEGEMDLGADPDDTYVAGRIAAWFDHYLKDLPVDTGPEFAYFRDWVDYSGNATPAYATASTVDVGAAAEFYLSGPQLVDDPGEVQAATTTFLAAGAGLPTSIDKVDALASLFEPLSMLPELDLPGTFTSFTTEPLAENLDVVGQPVLDLTVSAPTVALTQVAGPAGQLVLFLKLSEVAPDGTATLVRDLVAPVRISDATQQFTVAMPAIVHRFDAGNQLRLTVAGGSSNYRGGLPPTPVTITTGGTDQLLTLPTASPLPAAPIPPAAPAQTPPVVPAQPATPVTDAAAPSLTGGTGVIESTAALPETGTRVQWLVLILGMALIAGGCQTLRRRPPLSVTFGSR